MPIDFETSLAGAVGNDGHGSASLLGQVENTVRPPSRFLGTVSSVLVRSWDSPSLHSRFRVKIAGEWVPEANLLGPLAIDESLDSHTASAEFGLVGFEYGIAATVTTWTKVVPVEIFIDHGPPGSFYLQDEAVAEVGVADPGVFSDGVPDFAGYLLPRTDQSSEHGPVLRVRCGDEAAFWEKYEACEEFAPLAGFTRGQITATLLQAAGITSYTIPAGSIYTKALQATQKRLFPLLRDFFEPEGWKIRALPDRSFEVWRPLLKRSPEQPDAVWTKDDIVSLEMVPPDEVPSRWVINGTSVSLVDEAGVQTETTRLTVSGLYAQKVSPLKQDSSGVQSSTGLTPLTPVARKVREIVDRVTRQGDRILQQVTEEYGFYNPRGAQLVTNTGGAGSAGGGFDYVGDAWIDEDGEFVQWGIERYVLVGQRIETHTYDGSGNLTQTTVKTFGYFRRTAGVRTAGSSPTATTVVGTYVHGDGQSYSTRFEQFGERERQVITYSHDTTSGGRNVIEQDSFRYYAPKSRRDGGTGFYEVYDGTGQIEIVANWRLFETERTTMILASGLVRGEVQALFGWTAPQKADGQYDWGSHSSGVEEEVFQFISSEGKAYNRKTENQVEEVEYPAEGGRRARIFLGRLPATEYLKSVWTKLQSSPFEVVIDDQVAAEWFGFERATFDSEYVQNASEALAVIRERRRRALTNKIEVLRPATHVRPGDTVLLDFPDDGILARAMVIEARRTIDPPLGVPMGTYRLEMEAA